MLILQILVLVLLVSVGALYALIMRLDKDIYILEEELWDLGNEFYDLEEKVNKKK